MLCKEFFFVNFKDYDYHILACIKWFRSLMYRFVKAESL